MRERPPDPFQAQPLGDHGVVIHVQIVVEVHKPEISRLAEDHPDHYREGNADPENCPTFIQTRRTAFGYRWAGAFRSRPFAVRARECGNTCFLPVYGFRSLAHWVQHTTTAGSIPHHQTGIGIQNARPVLKLRLKPIAGLQRMPRQKFRRHHPPRAFRLQFEDPQRLLAAGDDDAAFVHGQESSGVTSHFHHFHSPDFQHQRRQGFIGDGSAGGWPASFNCARLGCPRCPQKRESAGPRREGAEPVPNCCRQVPVNPPVFLFDFRGVTGAFRRLRLRQNFSGNIIGNGFQRAIPRRAARAGREGWRIVRGRIGVRRVREDGRRCPARRPFS